MSISAAINALTTFFGFKKINFDYPRWHTEEWSNWDLLDSILKGLGATSVRGPWINSTAYLVSDRVIDANGTVYECGVAHTSAALPTTFAQDRTVNPTYWHSVSLTISDVANLQTTLTELQTSIDTKQPITSLATVATSGQYSDLLGKPGLFDGSYGSLTGKPTIFDGTWTSLSGKPTWTGVFDGSYTSLTGRPTLATVASTGAYSDLSGRPTIPTNTNQLTNGAGYATTSAINDFVNTLRQQDAGIIGFSTFGAFAEAPFGSFFRAYTFVINSFTSLQFSCYYIQYNRPNFGWVTIG